MQHGQFRGTPMWVPLSARQYDFVRLFLRFCSIVSLMKQPPGNTKETPRKRADERKNPMMAGA
jgi:hypothetical protein